MKNSIKIIISICICLLPLTLLAQGIVIRNFDGTKKILPIRRINGIFVDEDGIMEIKQTDSTSAIIPLGAIERLVTFDYKEVLEVEVTTGPVEIDQWNDYILKGSVEGVYSDVKVGFLVGKNMNLNESNGKKETPRISSGGEFRSMYLESDFDAGTTYYYRAFAEYANQTYYGEIRSFTTKQKAPSYALGDFYPDNLNPEGVVFYIESGGEHGKIVSWMVHISNGIIEACLEPIGTIATIRMMVLLIWICLRLLLKLLRVLGVLSTAMAGIVLLEMRSSHSLM
ncbi:MAG: hypothetical protein II826_09130 [Prevotella sp.]|nr:hypothetical protein [Prevotella sp.]